MADEPKVALRCSQLHRFLGKDEVIRLLLIAAIAGEHAVLIGPPGTAKSALIRTFARLIQANEELAVGDPGANAAAKEAL